ncbi:SDR family NAD(P)-dependent oxidoreductase [Streptomyces sp. NPDC088789]|uniref:type I polyketide synthase n=1 Tax=Streptomyces sp. NPDC088789 TaxID=3365899 RepID=UPI0038139E7F
MAMRHGRLPVTLHADEPSPHVDWSAGGVRLLTEAVSWEDNGYPRRAGVSSFGVSGTNAHLILEEAPSAESGPVVAESVDGPVAWVVSGRGDEGLRAQAARLASFARGQRAAGAVDGDWLAEVAAGLAGRAALERRAVITGTDLEPLLAGLDAVAAGEPSDTVAQDRALPDAGVVFVFPGQGGQFVGMGRGLLGSWPVFAERMAECEEALAPYVDWSLRGVVTGSDEGWLGRVDVVQPVLWAVMVSLAEVWRAAGVVPDAVVGHSQGEIAAAVVASRLSLSDGARVVALRSRALRELAGRGAMASLALSEQDVAEYLPQDVTVAAVNAPGQIVVSGPPDQIAELCARLDGRGVRARRIDVDYASHHAQVEAVEELLREELAGVKPRAGHVAMWSTVTGRPVGTEALDAGYWYRNLREPVRFADAVRRVQEPGPQVFVEISPHPVLALALEQSLTDGRVLQTLRRDQQEKTQLLRSLGAAWAAGLPVTWPRLLPAATPVTLPTYAFQRRRFWLEEPAAAQADIASTGLTPTDHPLLTAVAVLPGDDARLFTARLALHTHGWLRDHMTDGTVVVPPAAVVEMALHAGRTVQCPRLADLTIDQPPAFPVDEAVQIQLVVGGPDDDGDRRVDLYSRPADDAEADWRSHATGRLVRHPVGRLVQHPGDTPAPASVPWPPAEAEPVTHEAVRQALTEAGYDVESTLARVGQLWRAGDDLLAEVRLPAAEEIHADRFTLHPDPLHAVLQTIAAVTMEATPAPRTATRWRDVTAFRGITGDVRVRMTPVGSDTLSLHLTDNDGTAVATVGEVTLRPPTAEQARAWRRERIRPLHRLVWEGLGVPPQPSAPGRYAVVAADEDDDTLFAALRGQGAVADRYTDLAELPGPDAAPTAVPQTILVPVPPADPSSPDTVHTAVTRVLRTVQAWLADEHLAATRLALVTRSAVATDGGDVADLTGAAVWGLARSVQAEHPDRLTVVDLDERDESLRSLAAALATDQPQAAVRVGALFVPRLRPIQRRRADEAPDTPLLDRQGTVLITGATGTLGGLVARHLVREHGAGRLLLVGRRGATAPGMPELVAELTEAGAQVTVESCDVGDRDALAAVLDAVPAEHPLTAVVHAAGALDDGTVTSLTGDQVARVFRPKADAALHLHELTRDRADLRAFVLFSSAGSTLGSAGQGNYTAANAFLDALAHRRRAEGLPATSVAWGMWEERSGMTSHLDATHVRRITRDGASPMSTAEGLALLDTALATGLPATVAGPEATRRPTPDLPPVLWGANGAAPRPAAAGAERNAVPFARRLAGLPTRERDEAVLTLVQRTVADVLSHADADRIDPDRAFKELGFDSLTAVELRNRLATTIARRLSPSLVFDFPTPRALAAHLRGELLGSASIDPVLANLTELHTTLSSLEADDAVRDRLVARLQGLVSVLTGSAGQRDREPDSDDSDIEAASADEVLAILDQELDDSAAPSGPQGGNAG